ncbi:E3 ubiquitin-protein ligase TRIM45-like [Amphiura filiformis]|uniref:E3 ubiquitin-protein ligase TRIM45-like n=1 Tax=Amphiura filiformis TaxID=82378 RepID=UPI003B22167B
MACSLISKKYKISSNCGICLERFRNPRRLRCHHCFCEECLEDWISHNTETTAEIICPRCKKTTPIPSEGVRGFPGVQMEKAKEDYSKKICSKCKKSDQRVTVYCQDCKHYLCQSCYDVHKAWEAMKHHRIVRVEDLMSGKASLTDTKDHYCADHEGELNKFYCKTCKKLVCRDCILMVQHCRDHDYVTLKNAAAERLSVLDEEIKKCDDKKKKCRDGIEKIQTVASELNKAADDAKAKYEKLKMGYLYQVEELFAATEKHVTAIQQNRKGELDCAENDSRGQLKQFESAIEEGKRLMTGSASHYDVIANYDSVVGTLQDLNKIELNEVDDRLLDIPIMPIPPAIEFSQRWKPIGQMKVSCKEGPTGIAVTSDGTVAVCDSWHRILVFSKSGELMHTIDGYMLGGSGVVSITSTNGYVIPTYDTTCKLYDNNYKLYSEFKTYNANNEPSEARAVIVDKNGCIILGIGDNAISIHNADGSLKSSFATPYEPRSVAVTSHEEIVVAGEDANLQLYNYSDKCLQTLSTPPEVKRWQPRYVCCSKRDEVFVVNRGDPKAIYKYAGGRVYMGCVTTEVNDPRGIALSHDDQELYVTEYRDKLVNIFKTP